MSSFMDMVLDDNLSVFMNIDEFAKERTIKYDGIEYEDVPCVLNGFSESKRSAAASDHMQGLYRVTQVLHCRRSDLGGFQPEQGARISVSDDDDPSYYWDYYVASSNVEEGMLRVELEAIWE